MRGSQTGRRVLLARSLGFSLAALMVSPLNREARATSPARAPAELEDLIRRLTEVIYIGRFAEQMFMPHSLSEKMHTRNSRISQSELKLLPLSKVNLNEPIVSFFEINEAKPVLIRSSAGNAPLPTGRIYCSGFGQKYQFEEAKKYKGQRCIFLFGGMRNFGPLSFPSPYMISVGAGHWRDWLPIPIANLDSVKALAAENKFIKPQN